MSRLSAFSVRPLALLFAAVLAMAAITAQADSKSITVASTTSTEASGLFGKIIPQFEETSGIDVKVVAVGTGQAIEIARRGDADVLFVHHKPSEKEFIANGHGVKRHPVMYNDFIIVGPESDPAGIDGMSDASAAFKKIAQAEAPFASRGDNSGTHKKELGIWESAGIDPSKGSGGWYRETGSGMGATLNTAAAMGAYALADRGTWISFDNRQDLELLVEGDEALFNPYGVMLVNPEQHPHVNAEAGQRFIDWLISDAGQQAIADYRLRGKQLFHPNAE